MKITYDKVLNGERVITVSTPKKIVKLDTFGMGMIVNLEFFQTKPGAQYTGNRMGVKAEYFKKRGFSDDTGYMLLTEVDDQDYLDMVRFQDQARAFLTDHPNHKQWADLPWETI